MKQIESATCFKITLVTRYILDLRRFEINKYEYSCYGR